MLYIGIDLGGTNIAVGLVNEEGKILARKSVPTRADARTAEEVAAAMAEAAKALLGEAGVAESEIASVGVGSPGAIDREAGVVVSACNLPFRDTPLRAMLERYFSCPVHIENDANVAAWAEAVAGAARGTRDSLMLTLGTGVGGGIVIGGRLYGGCNNYGGEFGHMIICEGGEPCGCGMQGCLEAYASATALAREAKRAAEQHPESLLRVCAEREGGFTGRTAFDAAAMGDAAACGVLDAYVRHLAVGVINLIRIFQPQVLVIGGGVAMAGEALLVPLREQLGHFCSAEDVGEKKTVIRAAALGNDAGIIGAALLGMEVSA